MDKECEDIGDSFKPSFFEYDDDSYFDMDLTLPCNANNSPLEANKESEEFEFSVPVSPTDKSNRTADVDDVSPADDLFYRGQLLPLHLPPRLEMVRNLSSPKELDGNKNGFCRYYPGSRDSNQRNSSYRESSRGFAESEEKTHFPPTVKSGTKSKVKAPMFTLSKFSKEGMDDLNYSPAFAPPAEKLLRFMVKFKSMKEATAPFYSTDYSTKQKPDNPVNGNKTNTSTSVKHIVKKYAKLVKHRISSQRHNDAQTVDWRLIIDEECEWPCIEEQPERQIDVGSKHFDAQSCPPSTDSSESCSPCTDSSQICPPSMDSSQSCPPSTDSSQSCPPSMDSSQNFSTDLQSAIAYCKQSNGVIGKKNHSI